MTSKYAHESLTEALDAAAPDAFADHLSTLLGQLADAAAEAAGDCEWSRQDTTAGTPWAKLARTLEAASDALARHA